MSHPPSCWWLIKKHSVIFVGFYLQAVIVTNATANCDRDKCHYSEIVMGKLCACSELGCVKHMFEVWSGRFATRDRCKEATCGAASQGTGTYGDRNAIYTWRTSSAGTVRVTYSQTVKTVKRYSSPEKSSQSYGASLSIWDHSVTCHLTQMNVRCLTPARLVLD